MSVGICLLRMFEMPAPAVLWNNGREFDRVTRMDKLVTLCGIHSLGFAIFHILFWRIFRWPVELQKVSVPTRAMIQIFNLRLIYLFAGVAALCFYFQDELVTTPLGKAIMLGMSLFWLGRLIEQFIFLRYHSWMVHLLSVMFGVGAVLFAWPWL